MHTNNLHDASTLKSLGFNGSNEVINRFRDGNTLLFDTGHNPVSNISNDPSFIQNINYDVRLASDYAPGSTEDFSSSTRIAQFTPVIATNYQKGIGENNNVESFKIIDKENIRIGIIGGVESKTVSNEDSFSSLNAIALRLKKDYKCNLVVCLSSLGINDRNANSKFAEQSEFIDVIIAGQHADNKHQRPFTVKNKVDSEVIINYTGDPDMLLSTVEIKFDKKGLKNSIAFKKLLQTSYMEMKDA